MIWRYLPRRKYTQFHEFSVNSFLIISFSHRQFNEISIISMNFLLLVYPIKSTRIFRELNYFFLQSRNCHQFKDFSFFFYTPNFMNIPLIQLIFFVLHSVEITEIYSHIFWQIFRESNIFTKDVVKCRWFDEILFCWE